MYQSDLTS